MSNFRKYDQNQGVFRVLIPDELLEEDHPARIIDRVVETLDLSKIYEYYANEGNPPYHPNKGTVL
jgi:transposase